MSAILAFLFATIQMVVLVSIIGQAVEQGLCDITTIFILTLIGVFVICGVLHPHEFLDLVHGLIFYLLIPTMYLLLLIYAICNLHVISWGTREVAPPPTTKAEEVKPETKAKNGASKTPFNIFHRPGGPEDGWTVSCGSCCRCLCCPRPGESPTDARITRMLEQMEANHEETTNLLRRQQKSGLAGKWPIFHSHLFYKEYSKTKSDISRNYPTLAAFSIPTLPCYNLEI